MAKLDRLLVEHVARAMYNDDPQIGYRGYDNSNWTVKQRWERRARAAINAHNSYKESEHG